MAKQKNTNNKKLHSKLLGKKKAKKQRAKETNRQRIRELNQLANLSKTDSQEQQNNFNSAYNYFLTKFPRINTCFCDSKSASLFIIDFLIVL